MRMLEDQVKNRLKVKNQTSERKTVNSYVVCSSKQEYLFLNFEMFSKIQINDKSALINSNMEQNAQDKIVKVPIQDSQNTDNKHPQVQVQENGQNQASKQVNKKKNKKNKKKKKQSIDQTSNNAVETQKSKLQGQTQGKQQQNEVQVTQNKDLQQRDLQNGIIQTKEQLKTLEQTNQQKINQIDVAAQNIQKNQSNQFVQTKQQANIQQQERLQKPSLPDDIQLSSNVSNLNQQLQQEGQKPLETAVCQESESKQMLNSETKRKPQNTENKQVEPAVITKKSFKDKDKNKQKQELAQLQQLLKQKLKEIKTLSSKNNKLQAKYIDLFKQNKLVRKQSATVSQTLKEMVDAVQNLNWQSMTQANNLNSLAQNVKDLSKLVNTESIVKQEIIVRWKFVLSAKILEEIGKIQQNSQQKITEIQTKHRQSIKITKQTFQRSIQQSNKLHLQTSNQLRQKIISFESEIIVLKQFHKNQLSKIAQSHSKTIVQLKEQSKNQLFKSSSTQLQKLSSIHEQQFKQLYDEIQKLKARQKQTEQTIKDMDEKLDHKNAQLSKYMKQKLKLEHQINQMKVKLIKDQLQQTEQSSYKEEESVNERNQFLKIRQQLESMMEKRDHMKTELSKQEKELTRYKGIVDKKNNQIEQLLRQLNSIRKESFDGKSTQSYDSKNYNQKSEPMQKQIEAPTHIQIKSSEDIPANNAQKEGLKTKKLNKNDDKQTLQQKRQQYLRNVFVRYITALLKDERQSSQTLLRVILTILKVQEREKQQIEQLAFNKKKWWVF